MKIKSFISNKEVRNASWLIVGRIIQMLLSLIVGVLTARYLGPGNYGLIGYASAFVAFFTAFCTLGINSVIIKNFVDNPEEQGETIGTTIVLRAISSLLSSCTIISIVAFLDRGESTTIGVVALSCIGLLFQVFDTFNYWFQSRYQSKITTIVTFVAYVITSLYKIILLIQGKSILWFAFASSVDFICVAVFLYYAYKRENGPRLSFSLRKSKELFFSSYNFILSGMMVAVYGQTDKLMLKQMLDSTEVGYYSIGTTISNMWVFVLSAIIQSMYPTIMQLYKTSKEAFNRKNIQLYAIIFYTSVFVSLMILLLGDFVIDILYGDAYKGAANVLKIVTWYTAFSYLGVARDAWIVCEHQQKYLKYIYMGAAIINIVMNLVLIPRYGASGAAFASLLTQIFTCVIIPSAFKQLRYNVKLMFYAITLKGIVWGK